MLTPGFIFLACWVALEIVSCSLLKTEVQIKKSDFAIFVVVVQDFLFTITRNATGCNETLLHNENRRFGKLEAIW